MIGISGGSGVYEALALEGTINTPADVVPEATCQRLELLVGEYL